MRVLLATPSLDGIPSIEYLTSVMKTNALLTANGIQLDVNFIRGDQFISKARNGLIEGFLKDQQDMIFFIDDDEGWDEQSFLRMVHDPHEFVAAAVPKKTDGLEFNNVMLDVMDGTKECIIENGLIRAKQIGSGFIRLRRSAVEKLIKAYPRRYCPGDGGPHDLHYALFDAHIVWEDDPQKSGQFWGEDLEFCKKWISLGEYIWIDPNVQMTHTGRKTYKGNFLEFLKTNCSVQMQEIPNKEEPLKTEIIPETKAAIEQLAA